MSVLRKLENAPWILPLWAFFPFCFLFVPFAIFSVRFRINKCLFLYPFPFVFPLFSTISMALNGFLHSLLYAILVSFGSWLVIFINFFVQRHPGHGTKINMLAKRRVFVPVSCLERGKYLQTTNSNSDKNPYTLFKFTLSRPHDSLLSC